MKNWSWAIALILVCSLGLLPGMAESRITDISAAPQACGVALNDNGTVWLWGAVFYDVNSLNDHPGLGLQPAIMPGTDHVVAVSGCVWPVVLKDDGTVWVLKNYPAFENSSLLAASRDKEPVQVPGLDNIVAISGVNGDLIMLSENGTVWDLSYLLNGTIPVTGLSDIKAISMGQDHGLALKSDGTVWSWKNNNGFKYAENGIVIQEPDASNYNSIPEMVDGLTDVTAISAGSGFSMALKSDGTVWTWGINNAGQLGIGIPANVEENRTSPVRVAGLTDVVSIATGDYNALALKGDGTVWRWGRYGNTLVDNEYPYYNAPTQMENLPGIVKISSGRMNSLALDKDGVIWAWGDDEGGQLGDGREGSGLFREYADKVPFSGALAGKTDGQSPPISTPTRPAQAGSPASENSDIEYIAAVNDTIYSFTAQSLMALDSKGAPKWSLSITGLWTYSAGQILPVWKNDSGIDMGQMFQPVPIFAVDNGYIYLYTIKDPADGSYDAWQDRGSLQAPYKNVVKELVAVSPDGNIVWSHDFTDDVAVDDRAHLEAHGGRLYLYHDYNETVLDASGNVLFNVDGISDPASVDEGGNIYAVKALKVDLESYYNDASGKYFDYRIPSNAVEKITPDGNVAWNKELGSNVNRTYYIPSVWNGEIGLPLYCNGILYVPRDTSVLALNKNGDVLWDKSLDGQYRAFNLMPLDADGNLYLYTRTFNDANYTVIALSPGGTEIARYKAGPYIASAFNGVVYENGNPGVWGGNAGVGRDNLEAVTVTAYDLLGGKYLWNFTTPVGQSSTVTINESNVGVLFPDDSKYGMRPGSIINEYSRAEIIPAVGLTYVYFRTAVNDKPVVYNESTYTYYSALYAVDKDGKLVWQKPMDVFMTAAAANNTTIYYGTNGGGISVVTIGIAAGLTIGASILAFFLLGSVTRGRSKIDKNENRNRINKFIAERPGSTLYELSKELGMNIGTLRYHLMILSLNHRIVTYNDEGKFVRYFTNSNTYDRIDQMVISLARRESMGKILKALAERDEATNVELSGELGLPDSAVSKYLGVLSRKGVVVKNPSPTIRASYSISPDYRDRVANVLRLLGDGTALLQKSEAFSGAEA